MTKYSRAQIDEYRDVNVDHRWWDSTYDYWKNHLLPKFGIACDEAVIEWMEANGIMPDEEQAESA
jgi:hypothetical protein